MQTFDIQKINTIAEDELGALLGNGKFLSEDLIDSIVNKIMYKYDLYDYEKLVVSAVRKAYNYFKQVYSDSTISEEFDLDETIEKHDELNPLFFTKDKKLKPEVSQKIQEIVDKFVELLDFNNVKINIKDIIITGSNANYNYTKDSDVDIHIIADTKKLDGAEQLYNALYDAYRSLFSKKYDISFYDVPIELYVETEGTPLASGGIYSVKNDSWKKEPEVTKIPELDQKAFDKEYAKYEKKCADLLAVDSLNTVTEEDMNKIITELYELRQAGLESDGEHSIGNLIFKELRNNGYLDKLKQLRDDIISRDLSIEKTQDDLSDSDILNYKLKLTNAGGMTPEIDTDGQFVIDNIPEMTAESLYRKIHNLSFVNEALLIPTGRHNFALMNPSRPGKPSQLYKITGKVHN